MSTGKRLAKRSIIGTRVVAPGDDGKYYAGIIHAVKTPATFPENNNCINLTPNTRYSVRFESKDAVGKKLTSEFKDADLIGPGFRSIAGVQLLPGQKVFLTYNGREINGQVEEHNPEEDDLTVVVQPPGMEAPLQLQKRLEDVRLLESRKSARLADVDTDFARLADMAGDRRRASTTIDVPNGLIGSRKRRPSSSGDYGFSEGRDDFMDECNAALVLMSLSCSPHSPRGGAWGGRSSVSPGATSSSSGSSWRSGTPSPPPPSSSFSDEGIAMDYSEREDSLPRKKKFLCPQIHIMVYQCMWPGCPATANTRSSIESHVRNSHLGPASLDGSSEREEVFYYTEREAVAPAPPPTLSHRDMCRPPHEDPDYQRQIVGNYRQGILSTLHQQNGGYSQVTAGPMAIPSVVSHGWSNSHSPKHMKLSPSYGSYGGSPAPPTAASHSPTISPGRRPRSDNKKCRKVYGMEHRDLWCTQCKWKKACSRFGD